jgi:hypothetical protein
LLGRFFIDGWPHRNANRTSRTNHKVEKPIFISLRGPKALDDKGYEGAQRAADHYLHAPLPDPKLLNYQIIQLPILF